MFSIGVIQNWSGVLYLLNSDPDGRELATFAELKLNSSLATYLLMRR